MRRYWHVLLLLAAATVLSMACNSTDLPSPGHADHGRLAVGYRTNLLAVHGQWNYYPRELLYPLDFEQHGAHTATAGVPAPVRLGETSRGYGTYRLSIHAAGSSGYGGILVPSVGSALALWVDGKKVAEAGQVGSRATDEAPSSDGVTALFRQPSDGVDLVLQVSDLHHGSTGRVAAPVLYGTAQSIVGYESVVRGLTVALLALLAAFGVLFLVRGLVTRDGRAYGVFGLCIAALLRQLLVHGMPGLPTAASLAGPLPWMLAERLGVFSLFALYIAYLSTLLGRFDDPVGRTGIRALVAVSVVASFGSLFVPVSALLLSVAVAGTLLTLGLIAAVVWSAISRSRGASGDWAAIELAGGVVLALAASNDLLVYLGFSSIGYVGPIAAVVFGALVWFELPSASTASGAARADSSAPDMESFAEGVGRPLRSIVGLAESLLSGRMGDLDDEQVVSLSLIAASGLRLSNAVADLVDHNRLARRELELELAPVAIEPLVERVGDYLKPLLLVRSVEIRNELPRDLPPVRGDRRRIEQILYNVLAQGLRHREHGELVVSGRDSGELVEVEISSAASAVDDNAGPVYPGDGQVEFSRLRMAVAAEIVRLHGGRLIVKGNEEGERFDILFTLPKARETETSPPEISEQLIQLDELAPASRGAVGSEGAGDGKFRILLGESDLTSLQTMKNYLVRERYSVTTAYDGEEVLRRVREARPDLLLVDASLPGVDGMEVCRRVRKTYAATELPVLVLVDKDQLSSLMEGMTAGASDFISKPIVPDEFLARVKTHINLAKMNLLYSRFVPVELLHFLGHENVIELKLGDQIQREMTILFVDIRAFTNLSEGMTPQENFKFINSYLARITPIIRENNGFIDKYIGDAILALYPGSPEDALRSAIRMVDYLQEYNGYRRNSGYRPINIGIGIHTGNLIVGIIGDADRMQGTVISDAVNLASRVQDVTKLYGANIIISQDTFVRLENPTTYNFRFLGKVKVKGKNQSVSLFEVFDGESPERVALKSRTKQGFEDAILLFSQRKFAEATEAFRRIAAQNPNDRAALLFLNRAELFLKREKANWLLQ